MSWWSGLMETIRITPGGEPAIVYAPIPTRCSIALAGLPKVPELWLLSSCTPHCLEESASYGSEPKGVADLRGRISIQLLHGQERSRSLEPREWHLLLRLQGW